MSEQDAERLSRVIVELRRAQRTRRPAGEGPAEPAPLTMMQKEVLGCVAATPGIGTSQIARALHLKPNTVSGVVSHLVGQGYLQRSPDESDRRAARLTLTADAARDRAARWEGRADRVATALGRLDEDQRETLRRSLPALEALRDAMQEAALDPGE
ncbi:DNA-binding MarR family transcriptional regulator [Kineosphaera limosa]|nr:MarR family transcriptional regulator [Kineosphaera limosa]NYE00851.1 DNA-binding MarR family transcriptional regulator [Kineosphaera limosa]